MSAPQFRLVLLALVVVLLVPGCAWFDSVRGDGFQTWNQSLGGTIRSNDPAAQPSGFFTDKRSEQIEQNLGGGF
jgi:hypothetical protein